MFIKESSVPNIEMDSQGLSDEDIKQRAIIYKKQSIILLGDYQVSVNIAAQEICLQNPTYISSCWKL